MFALWANICSRNTERSEVLPKQISEAYLRPLASYEVTRLLAKSEAFRLTGTKAKLLCLIAKCEAFRVRNVMHHFVMLYVSRRRQPNSKQPTTRRVVTSQLAQLSPAKLNTTDPTTRRVVPFSSPIHEAIAQQQAQSAIFDCRLVLGSNSVDLVVFSYRSGPKNKHPKD